MKTNPPITQSGQTVLNFHHAGSMEVRVGTRLDFNIPERQKKMPNNPEPGGFLYVINLLGWLVLKVLMGSWDATFDKNARKYTLLAGSLFLGGILGLLTLLAIRYFPFYPIDALKPESRETKLFVCFVIIPVAFILICFGINSIRQRIESA